MFCFIDYYATQKEIKALYPQGFVCIFILKCTSLHSAIIGYVDIGLALLHKCKKEVVIHKNMVENFNNLFIYNRIKF